MSSESSSNPEEQDTDVTAQLPAVDVTSGPEPPEDAPLMPAVPVSVSELVERLREVEQQLDQKVQQVNQLEARLEQEGKHLTTLADELVESRARQTELEAQLEEAQAHAQSQARLVAERKTSAVRHHEQDYADLRSRTERQLEALCTWEGFRAASAAMLQEADARNALLEAKVSSLMDTVRALEGGRPRSAPQSQSEALKSEVKTLQAQITTLRAELAVERKGRPQSGPEAQAGVAPMGERNAPQPADVSDAPVNATVVMYGDQWEYSEEPGDSPTGEMERISEPGAEVPVRALVRLGEGGELIYPLGRRTTIGRTADNNIQIDAPNVSRHHAVLLASDEHCRVEDLDSTNGVLVNGHRVTRQTLQDGDTVTIGKTEFRFMQRS